MSIRIQPRARAEAEQAAAWYEEQRPGLGIEFVLELDAAIERAEASPLGYEQVFADVRRSLLSERIKSKCTERTPTINVFLVARIGASPICGVMRHEPTLAACHVTRYT